MKLNHQTKIDGLAIKLLNSLGNRNPSQKQINLTSELLIRTHLPYEIIFHPLLTQKECYCLLLAANGKTINESAELLDVKPTTIKTWRSNVIQKLDCKSMAHAVTKGISFGYLPANMVERPSKKPPTFVGRNF